MPASTNDIAFHRKRLYYWRMAQQSMAPVRVLVVEDHPLYRYAIEETLADCEWCERPSSCADPVSAAAHLRSRAYDVIVLDLDLSGSDGLEVAAAAADRGVNVLVVSASVSTTAVRRALHAGVSGYLTKDATPEQIRAAVRATARGQAVFSPPVQGELRRALRAETGAAAVLTDRERSVLQLSARGYTRGQVASQLHVSSSTVKAHLASVYRKLGVTDKAAAVATAMRRGWLTTPDQVSAPDDDRRV
jgi:two-component system nitrate/nitrite response regulator NarL